MMIDGQPMKESKRACFSAQSKLRCPNVNITFGGFRRCQCCSANLFQFPVLLPILFIVSFLHILKFGHPLNVVLISNRLKMLICCRACTHHCYGFVLFPFSLTYRIVHFNLLCAIIITIIHYFPTKFNPTLLGYGQFFKLIVSQPSFVQTCPKNRRL